MTKLLTEALEAASALSAERQDELARMILSVVETDRSDLRLSPEQQDEVRAAMAEDGPYLSDKELDAFFETLLK